MKFTKNRLLSLLLVLAMLFALATTAFAEGGSGSESGGETPTPTPGAITNLAITNTDPSVAVGATLQLNLTKTPTDGTGEVIWTSADDAKATVSSTGLVTGVAVTGDAGVTITAKVKDSNPEIKAERIVKVTQATINLTSDLQSFSKSFRKFTDNDTRNENTIKTALTAEFNTKLAAAANLSGSAKFLYKDQIELGAWSTSGNFATASTADNGSLTYTAEIKLKDGVSTDNYAIGTAKTVTATVRFTTVASFTYTYAINDAATTTRTVACAKNASPAPVLKQTVTTTDTLDSAFTMKWYKVTTSGGTETLTQVGNAITGVTTGSADATLTVPVDTVGTFTYRLEVEYTKNGLSGTGYGSDFTVTVNEPYRVVLTPSTTSSYVNSYVTYTATVQKFTGTGTDGYTNAAATDYDGITYSASSPDGSVLIGSTGSKTTKYATTYVNLYGVSASSYSSKITVTATAWKNNAAIGSGEHKTVTFYPVSTSDVYIAPTTATSATMDESALLSAVQAVRTNAKPVLMKFTSNCGTFNYSTAYTSYASNYSSSSYKVYNTTFTPNTYNYANFSNNPTATFYATDDNGNFVVATGTIKFSAASSISYSTTASTPVYFKASDFTDYFTKAVGGSYSSSYYAPSLSYVYFGTPRVSNSSVTSGTLYYNNSYVTSSTQVSAANLGYVSYTPSSSTYTYTVSIPFTAYGTYGYTSTNRSVSGTVTIKVNDGHVITMVGTDFKTASIWSDITSKHPGVSYVSFSQPQSTVGKLYYGYSSIANKGSLVSYTDRFNNSSYNYSYASTNKSIDGIYFVPAADCLDTVTLTYTAYTSATATTGVSDTITFTITKKTASSIFNDVTASNTGKWSADAIDFLARNSIVEGGSYGTFNPNGNMTRGDFVLMLYRMAGKPSVSGISNPFTDVKSTDYYYNAILWAYRNDIVTGVDAKTFAPKKNITREQIAATLYRMAGSPSASGYLTGYYDYAKIHSYATNAMRWAISNGVITGSNGYLTPTNNATRAQVATMLHRYLTK